MTKTIQLSTQELDKLQKLLVETDQTKLIDSKSEYELFRGLVPGGLIIAYRSGKLVMNTPAAHEFITKLICKILSVEQEYDYIIGSDETGKGEWFGPLVVVAVALKPGEINDFKLEGVMDSKILSKGKILQLGELIRQSKVLRASRTVTPQGYNELYSQFSEEGKNLNDLLAWAHTATIKDLLEKMPDAKTEVIIDKFDIKATDLRLGKVKEFDVKIIQMSKAEAQIPVAAASILAKLIYEEEVDTLEKHFNLSLRQSTPHDIPNHLLPKVAKLHFKNVQLAYSKNS